MLSDKDSKRIATYLAAKDNATVAYPYTKTLAVYSLNDTAFAYLETGKQLLRLSLRIDQELSKLLREQYEEVLPAQQLDPRIWNTIIISGQLSFAELTALIDHSYQLAAQINHSDY